MDSELRRALVDAVDVGDVDTLRRATAALVRAGYGPPVPPELRGCVVRVEAVERTYVSQGRYSMGVPSVDVRISITPTATAGGSVRDLDAALGWFYRLGGSW